MAQSVAGTSIDTNAQATARTVCYELRIAWGRTAATWPTDWATQSTDETSRLLDVSWDRRFSLTNDLRLGQAPVAQLRFTLNNSDQRFSPFNVHGALYSSLSGNATTGGGDTVRYSKVWQTPVRLRMGFTDSIAGAEYLTVFSGLIDRPEENYGLSGDKLAVTALDRGGALLDNKISSVVLPQMGTGGILPNLYIATIMQMGGVDTSGLDYGMTPIPYAWTDDEDIWSEVQAVASADGGYAYFDELGVFKFRNASWWARATDSTTSQATFSTALFQDLTPITSHANIATGAIAEYQARTHGGQQIVWRASSTLILPPGVTTIEARFNYPVSKILEPKKPDDWFPVSAGGVDMSDSVTLSYVNVYAQRTTLSFNNTSNATIYIPNMKLRGYVLIGGPQEQVTVNASALIGSTKQVKLAGNPYMQTWQQANIAATLAAYRLRYPRLTYRMNGPALPWLQLGDMVTINATAPVTTNRYAIITGLSFSWRPDAPWLMTVDAIDTGGLFEYSNYFIVGTDSYNGTEVAFV